jgi:hypothetical protein
MHKIKQVSFLFRWLLQLLFIAVPIALIIFWLEAPQTLSFFSKESGISINFIPEGVKLFAPLTMKIKMLSLLICLFPVGIIELIFYFLIKLFRSYERGEIFILKSVNLIKYTGWTLLIGELVINPLAEALLSAVLTMHNPPHYRYAQINISAINLGLILMAVLTILISWIMAEACQLREEQALTI